jgi:hypothetical protein
MLRVSATDVDQLRYYRHSDWMEFEELLSRFKDDTQETQAMRAGTAWHKFLDGSGEAVCDVVEQDGFAFRMNLDAALNLPKLREVKIERTFRILGEDVTLVGKTDGIEGRRIWDHKLTETFDPENYFDSLQWRIYLVLFDADAFTYNVFEGGEARRTKANASYTDRGLTVWDIDQLHQLTVYRYDQMESDVMRGLTEFVEFAKMHLPERFGQGMDKQLPI